MWKRVRTGAQIAFGVLAVGFLVWAIASNWSAVIKALAHMNPLFVIASVILIFVGLYVNMLSWRAVVAALGTPLTRAQAATVFFTSQLGKYIPGGIWPVVTSARLGQAFGLAAVLSVSSMTIALLLSLTVGSVLAVGALFLVPAIAAKYSALPIVLIALGVIALSPPVLNRLIMLALRILRRSGTLPKLASRPFAAAIGWSIMSWLCFGVALFLLTVASGAPVDATTLVGGISGYALSWVAGFVAILVPAGAGVREAVLVLVLSGELAVPTVLGVAIVHRLIMTMGDVAMLGFTRHSRRATLASTPVTRAAEADLEAAVGHDAAGGHESAEESAS
ncbi:MAG: glycosyltransferase 2 family protein [Actinomycetota bacterium]|jgi:uncharacterized membrane protein YbhN (UPF0104 family)|nr:glycosyltransferase 2 family protein [Actinomycetota bacterium]